MERPIWRDLKLIFIMFDACLWSDLVLPSTEVRTTNRIKMESNVGLVGDHFFSLYILLLMFEFGFKNPILSLRCLVHLKKAEHVQKWYILTLSLDLVDLYTPKLTSMYPMPLTFLARIWLSPRCVWRHMRWLCREDEMWSDRGTGERSRHMRGKLLHRTAADSPLHDLHLTLVVPLKFMFMDVEC